MAVPLMMAGGGEGGSGNDDDVDEGSTGRDDRRVVGMVDSQGK
jgi:hypothetical protein